MNEVLGRVLTVDGSQITASLDSDPGELSSVRVGAMVSINGPVGEVVGTVSAVRLEPASPTGRVLVVELLGVSLRLQYCSLPVSRGLSHYTAPRKPLTYDSTSEFERDHKPQPLSNISV